MGKTSTVVPEMGQMLHLGFRESESQHFPEKALKKQKTKQSKTQNPHTALGLFSILSKGDDILLLDQLAMSYALLSWLFKSSPPTMLGCFQRTRIPLLHTALWLRVRHLLPLDEGAASQ